MVLPKLVKNALENEKAKGIIFDNIFYRILYSGLIKRRTRCLIDSYPNTVNIENTNICNSKCVMCPHSIMKRKKGIMNMNLFKKIADDCRKHNVKTIHINHFGEPLIDSLLFERIKYLKKIGIPKVAINTNASLMDETTSRKLVESGLDLLFISFDGATRETYNKIRIGLDFDKIVSNINKLFEIKKKMNSASPRVKLRFVVMKGNEGEVKKYVREWKESADGIVIAKCENWGGAVDVDDIKTGKKAKYACSKPFGEMTVSWDGRVFLCCIDYDGFHIVGDMNKDTIDDINNSEVLKKIRKIHVERDFEAIELCSNCTKLDGTSTCWWYSRND